MCPGCSDVVTSPPDAVSCRSIWAMAAFAMPYSPKGGVPLSSVIGTFRDSVATREEFLALIGTRGS